MLKRDLRVSSDKEQAFAMMEQAIAENVKKGGRNINKHYKSVRRYSVNYEFSEKERRSIAIVFDWKIRQEYRLPPI